ncbi:MAG: hypothetical protein HYZ54_05045 [Ignavibacteriae bacterium]|nr:hypothetical protein [Ignavibacteriota bacterium]
MKYFLGFLCSLFITINLYSQDTKSIDTTNKNILAIQPIIGLGLINGLRIGPALSFNDLITVEAGAGFGIRNFLSFLFGAATDEEITISETITYSPYRHDDGLVFSLNHLSVRKLSFTTKFLAAQVGIKAWLGKKEFCRFSVGYQQQYSGRVGGRFLDGPALTFDLVLYIGALRTEF